MLVLAFSGLAVLRYTSGAGGAYVAAALLALAFFTKQHAAWFVLAAFLYSGRERPSLGAAVRARGRDWLRGGFGLLSLWLGSWCPFYTLEIAIRWFLTTVSMTGAPGRAPRST